MDKENVVRMHSQVTDSKIFGNWASTCIRDRVPHLPFNTVYPFLTSDEVNQFILPPVFNHFFQYHFMLVQTLQEAGAKTRRETQENMRVEGASCEGKGSEPERQGVAVRQCRSDS